MGTKKTRILGFLTDFFELIFDRKMKDRRVFEIEINFMILSEKKPAQFSF